MIYQEFWYNEKYLKIGARWFSPGHIVNQSKSSLYPIHLKPQMSQWIKSSYKYIWTTSSWHYLGIDIPPNLANIKSLTLKILSHQIYTLLKGYNNQALSLLERIHVLKWFVLPKILYTFRVLPIWIPLDYLKKWQTAFFNFIWNSKCHRVAKFHLIRPLSQGSTRLMAL